MDYLQVRMIYLTNQSDHRNVQSGDGNHWGEMGNSFSYQSQSVAGFQHKIYPRERGQAGNSIPRDF